MRFKEWGDDFVGGVWTTTNARRKLGGNPLRVDPRQVLHPADLEDRRGVPGRVSRHRPRDRSMDHLGLRQQGPGL
jgi:hypothetical protein